MNKVNFSESKFSLKTIYLLSLSLLVLYGTYKNGLVYYFNGSMSLLKAMYPLFFCLSSYVIGLLIEKKFNYQDLSIYSLMISLAMPYQIPFLLYLVILTVSLIIFSKLPLKKGNIIVFIIALFHIFLASGFENAMEQGNQMFYSTIEIFLGRSIGGIANTSIFLSLISLAFFLTNFYYKKEIPLISIACFELLTFIRGLIINDSLLFNHLLYYLPFYLAIFVMPINRYSPLTKKNQIIFAFLTGVLMFFATYYLNYQLGPILACVIMSLSVEILELLTKKAK